MERRLASGFSSDCLPDKGGLNSPIIVALRANSRHLDRMYNRTLASADTGVWNEMTDTRDLESFYREGMRTSVTERLTEATLERMRTSAIGGASLSLGVILLLLQTDLGSRALIIALYSAIFAIPAWVAAWQYVEAYMFCGKDSHEHFNSFKGSLVAVLLAVAGMLLLFTSVVSLIWHMSMIAAIVFLVLSIAAAVLVSRHHHAVRVFTDRARGGDA